MFIEDGGAVSVSLPCTFVRIYLYLHTFPTSGKSKCRVPLTSLCCERLDFDVRNRHDTVAPAVSTEALFSQEC